MSTSTETHPREREIFLEATEIEAAADRAAYLDQACGEDAHLRERVNALLEADREATLIEPPEWMRGAAEWGAQQMEAARAVIPSPRNWSPPSAEELSALLPGYEVEAMIGCGGMGAVYRGVQTSLERAVAIKILPPEFAAEPGFSERFRREALAMAKLQHPNIVTIFDYGSVTLATGAGRTLYYFVMEFIDGTDVQHLIRSGALTSEAALKVIAQICEALQYAHAQGYVHRDIKPANVFVTQEGLVKVGDFGIAKLTGSASAAAKDSQLTLADHVMGTPNYLAPENLGSGRKVDHRADIYSLGVMFYEMLTGNLPKGVFPPPSQTAHVDTRLDQVVLKAMMSEPDKRYQHAAEVKQDVDNISASISKHAGEKRRPRSRTGIWTLGAAACVLASGAWWFMERGNSSHPPGRVVPLKLQIGTFENSLGMRFVPVPITGGPTKGQQVLFSIWETRVQDYAAFAPGDPTVMGLPQGPDHPAVNISWDDAKAFCDWLTKRELEKGVIQPGQIYRLPTDHEWSCAVGLGHIEDANEPPDAKRARAERAGGPHSYPWGDRWPPPNYAANLDSEATVRENLRDAGIPGYVDGFPGTSPVGSFPANPLGLNDLSGNAAEWCADFLDPGTNGRRVMRGASWAVQKEIICRSDYRGGGWPTRRLDQYGFRIVLAQTIERQRAGR